MTKYCRILKTGDTFTAVEDESGQTLATSGDAGQLEKEMIAHGYELKSVAGKNETNKGLPKGK